MGAIMPLRQDELEDVRRIVREEIALALAAKPPKAVTPEVVEEKPAKVKKLGGKK